MPTLDEPALRDLMQHATDDLHAPVMATRIGTTGPRHRPGTLIALGAGGVAAAVAIGLVVLGPGQAHPATTRTATGPAHAAPTPAQRVLYRLASMSERAPLASAQTVPGRPDGGGVTRGFFTTAELAALPIRPDRLRVALLRTADRVEAADAADAAVARAVRTSAKEADRMLAISRTIAAESPSEKVFTEAAGVLGDARTSPALRAAVYEVLADTPGVTVTVPAGTARDPMAPEPLTGGGTPSGVEIRGLTGPGGSGPLVVNATTGAVITLPPLLSQRVTGMSGVHLPPLVISPTR